MRGTMGTARRRHALKWTANAFGCGRPGLPPSGARIRPAIATLTVVWLRLLVDAHGKPLFTLQELAAMVGSANRQAASQHLEDFRQCGEDFRAFVLRKRKVDATVVEGVWHELLKTPLAGPTELVPRVNTRLGRHDLTVANIEGALEQISCVPVLRALRRQLEAGTVPYQEAYLLAELLENLSLPATPPAGWSVPAADRGMRLADPTALAALVTPDVPLAQVPGSLCWLTFLMTLFYWNVPLSVLGRWCGVHKTTILRWVWGWRWPCGHWSPSGSGSGSGPDGLCGREVAQDPWALVLLVRRLGCAHGAADAGGPPAVAEPWACRWVGRQLRQLNKVPRVLITDGLQAYAYLVPGATHVLCRFHHQQGVTHWLQQHVETDAEINARKPAMKQVLQTRDKRTVRRRLARLRTTSCGVGDDPLGEGLEEKLPQLICSVGSVRLPSTTNAMERFFRAFQRFYRTRGGFHSVLSAKRELLLFFVVYVFTHTPPRAKLPSKSSCPRHGACPCTG